jgi:hypothetical protein
MNSDEALRADHFEIRRLIDHWVLWRDAGEWQRFATLFHSDARMYATWFQASATDFIAQTRAAFEKGSVVYHALGASSVDIVGSRAIAQTKMEIIQRAVLDGVQVEVSCRGRFWDAIEKRNDRWGMLHRRVIYELDRMVPVDSSVTLKLDADLLAAYPYGYQHLAYLQVKLGMKVYRNLPGTRGPEVAALQERGRRWLAGADAACLMGD